MTAVVLAKCIGRRQKGQATAENQAIYTVVRPGEYLTGADSPDKAGSAREELSARFENDGLNWASEQSATFVE